MKFASGRHSALWLQPSSSATVLGKAKWGHPERTISAADRVEDGKIGVRGGVQIFSLRQEALMVR
ncbi:hypothetical protein [uncultured Cohaesibacter sp.]|uniref:hypothetical protein n=1 Tax=uncultured Cohaesibacter sp. TaxID=1002546 RepID=UPI00293122F8|nr:hypothetical protein [uncultured Cohaesibacter sp.]